MVQATLIFGAETWFMTPKLGMTLGGFHHWVACRLVIMQTRQDITSRLVYPPMYASMTSVRLEELETYVLRHQNIIAQYIATCPILELCLLAE